MGVLRVNDGTVLLPDWRNVGCGGAAGSGFTAVTDHFNRANSSTTLGSPWTVVSAGGGGSPAWGISSNQAYCAASYIDGFGTVHSTLAYLDVGSGDVDITVTLAVPSNNNGVLLRLSGSSSFFIVNSADITWVSSGGSVLHTHSSGFASGDVMRVLAVGSSIQVFKNGTSVNSITDTRNQTATRHGMVGDAVFAPSMRLDDFTIAPGVTATTGRLKLWDGTRWMREACTTGSAYPTLTLADSPAAYWRLGDTSSTAADASGNSHSGSYIGAVSHTPGLLIESTDGAATFAGGILNGATDTTTRIEVSYGAWMNTASLTVEALIQTSQDFSSAYNPSILDRDAAARVFQFRLKSTGELQFILIGTTVTTVTGTRVLNDGMKHHVAATYDGAHIYLYVDGVQDGSTAVTTALPQPTSGAIYIGANGSSGTTQWFVGTIDEAAFYTSALTASQIATRAAIAFGHPLKMWDGTTWQSVACMTPA